MYWRSCQITAGLNFSLPSLYPVIRRPSVVSVMSPAGSSSIAAGRFPPSTFVIRPKALPYRSRSYCVDQSHSVMSTPGDGWISQAGFVTSACRPPTWRNTSMGRLLIRSARSRRQAHTAECRNAVSPSTRAPVSDDRPSRICQPI